MCKFCDILLDENSKDDISHYNHVDCSKCEGCDSTFSINGYKDSKDNVRIWIEYYQKVCNAIAHPFSESIPFNFCLIYKGDG